MRSTTLRLLLLLVTCGSSSRSPWKQKPSLLGVPEKWGRKKEKIQLCLTYKILLTHTILGESTQRRKLLAR